MSPTGTPRAPRKRRASPVLRIVLHSEDDELTRVLRRGQALLLSHPVAAQALVSGLAEEGKRFATTTEGQAWKERLTGSELVSRVRVAWEATTVNILSGPKPQLLPTEMVDAFLQAAQNPEMETLLGSLFLSSARPSRRARSAR